MKPMPEIWGKKCIFIDILVVDCFASFFGVHASSYKEKKSLQPFLLRFKSSNLMKFGKMTSFLHLTMKINDENC